MSDNSYIIGNIIREQRENLNVSKRTLAKLVGISDTEIKRIEDGMRKSFNLNILNRICNVLGINMNELLFEIPKSTDKNKKKFEKEYVVKVTQYVKDSYNIDAKNESEAVQKTLNYLAENKLIVTDPSEGFDIEVYSRSEENLENFDIKNDIYRVKI